MDQSSPQFGGDAEECSSSESGWTMYLASPMHDGSNGDDDDDDGEVDGGSSTIGDQSTGDGEGKEDDDSMASDASSGMPRKQRHGNVCVDDGGVVKDRNTQCSSRYSRKNHKVEIGEDKGILSKPSDQKGENGDSISIHGSSKMRVKSIKK